jgi:hypothetical protein
LEGIAAAYYNENVARGKIFWRDNRSVVFVERRDDGRLIWVISGELFLGMGNFGELVGGFWRGDGIELGGELGIDHCALPFS